MNEFYEKHRDDSDSLMIRRNGSHIFPAHFHRSPEILLVNKGGYRITVSGAEYEVRGGSVAVIDSFEVHSYDARLSDREIDDCVIIFPYKHLSRLQSYGGKKKIKHPVIYDSELCSSLLLLADTHIKGSGLISDAAADLFFTLLDSRLEYTEAGRSGEGNLVRAILAYIQDNFKGDVSRRQISTALGYSEEHISRVFHAYLGKGLSDYVNTLRLSYIDKCLASGDGRAMTELIYEAGFCSQQTYYRSRARERLTRAKD
ncbi:MAG: helix-turn-helix domain-containing protein [Clostridia bacterium]|nr:helix-turn-helix domain-containing protein [Clostridia bacterium]